MVRMMLMIPLVLGFAHAANAQAEDEMKALETYCMPDVERLCPDVQPGHEHLKKCLRHNRKEVSVGCAEALQTMKEG